MKRNQLKVALAGVAFIFSIGSTTVGMAAENNALKNAKATHNVVIESVSGDPKAWEKLLNNTENLIKAFEPESTRVEIVSHGDGLKMLMKSSTESPTERMHKLAKNAVTFAACENTMKRMKLTKEDLIEIAKPVDAGIAQVVRRQEDGWSFLSK